MKCNHTGKPLIKCTVQKELTKHIHTQIYIYICSWKHDELKNQSLSSRSFSLHLPIIPFCTDIRTYTKMNEESRLRYCFHELNQIFASLKVILQRRQSWVTSAYNNKKDITSYLVLNRFMYVPKDICLDHIQTSIFWFLYKVRPHLSQKNQHLVIYLKIINVYSNIERKEPQECYEDSEWSRRSTTGVGRQWPEHGGRRWHWWQTKTGRRSQAPEKQKIRVCS